MTLTQVWGALAIFILCPLLGGLPLIGGITRLLTGKRLAQQGTGNLSVSAAFYHGGVAVGLCAVASEALKGIAAVLLARQFFPVGSVWEILALVALVMGRYAIAQGAGTTNVFWGYWVHDWRVAALVTLMGGVSFTVLRQRQQAQFGILVLLPVVTLLVYPTQGDRLLATLALSGCLAVIYRKIPDDLSLSATAAQPRSQTMLRFFQGNPALLPLERAPAAQKVGQKAATLGELLRQGYPVPSGWVLLPGDDPASVLTQLQPTPERPLVVRSSAIGEDSVEASAAGQYQSFLHIRHSDQLAQAIRDCWRSYDRPQAVQYRRDRGLPDGNLAVIIQTQIQGVISGVAFSRDPIARCGDAVMIEALPGEATQVVSGRVTPATYRVLLSEAALRQALTTMDGITDFQERWQALSAVDWPIASGRDAQVSAQALDQVSDQKLDQVSGQVSEQALTDDIPPTLLRQVAFLARDLEAYYHGIPQDVEWTYDGEKLWLLQSRPITTLLPIWTRKIAAEVIPGYIRPLTWSINRPLTCGVWGQLFTVVLGDTPKASRSYRARGLDFNQTATLLGSAAYFNATLLGTIFRRMGLPPESLEFLTRGTKFSKPPLRSTLRNLPGLLRLLGRELCLEQDWRRSQRHDLQPLLQRLSQAALADLDELALGERVESILVALQTTTYYSILAPLSLALRQAILRVPETALDTRYLPEVAVLRELRELAAAVQHLLPRPEQAGSFTDPRQGAALFAQLAELPDARSLLERFDQIRDRFGYLSEVATDIAVPTWQEDPLPLRNLLAQFVAQTAVEVPRSGSASPSASPAPPPPALAVQIVQRRLVLKGQVSEVYNRLLAELRWAILAIARRWQAVGRLAEVEDIFFLELDEIREFLAVGLDQAQLQAQLQGKIHDRRAQFEADRQQVQPPFLAYGQQPLTFMTPPLPVGARVFQGLGASPGQAIGTVKILKTWQTLPAIDHNTILVVPYTDAGWAPLLAQAGGIIAEVGGRLSHGAIVAREYGIPAVMDVHHACQLLQEGQRVRLDGQQGRIEVLD